jgi:hypothetical protein
MWWKNKKTTRKELVEDAKEDLELKDEDADKLAGGQGKEKWGASAVDKTTPTL